MNTKFSLALSDTRKLRLTYAEALIDLSNKAEKEFAPLVHSTVKATWSYNGKKLSSTGELSFTPAGSLPEVLKTLKGGNVSIINHSARTLDKIPLIDLLDIEPL